MDSSSPEVHPRITVAGETATRWEPVTDQPLSPKDERIVSANPPPDAAIVDVTEQPQPSDAGGDLSVLPPLNAYTSHEQMLSYGREEECLVFCIGNLGHDGHIKIADCERIHY
uniref:Uncharacterized protein n=1 Tax=Manihot esculenta TaxID=3983 RepID=A0A2C9WGP1_MANES